MGPALDFIHDRRKQELCRIEEMDRVEGNIELFFFDCALKVLIVKCTVIHCLQRQVIHSVNHCTTQVLHRHNEIYLKSS